MARLTIVLYLLISFVLGAQNQSDIWMHPNRGQWHENILYEIELNIGALILEKDGFTVNLSNLGDHLASHHHEAENSVESENVKRHAVFAKFLNSSWKGKLVESKFSPFYRNYFIGQDSSKWASTVHSIQKVRFIDFYPNIDLVYESTAESIKYSFHVYPGGDPSQIEVQYKGADNILLTDNQLQIETIFGPFFEKNLDVWNENKDGIKSKVTCNYNLIDQNISFDFPNEFNSDELLIIDPELTFSSFTGSTVDNWGFTAAPDINANLFAAGIVFGTGYPITAGAYDASFNGGEGTFNIDIGISKFNDQGTALLYSTLIGGNKNETPNSIVSNNANELYVLGVTSSTNFPLAGVPVQNTFNGGPTTVQNALQFTGSDLVVFKLNASGNTLLGATYLGGSGLDGLNTSSLHYNYGDQFRGEIMVDNVSNVYIASSTQSSNFPASGLNTTLDGTQDAVVAKFSSNLNTLFWSTYFGGPGVETGNAIQISSSGNVYLTGGTNSTSLGFSNGHINNFIGGNADGYIAQLNGSNSNLISGTYVGTNNYDQSYFVQLDLDDNVYVFGQTNGSMPITSGLYSNPNSGQFIRKYNEALNTVEWNTLVGGGNGAVEISPTAFLVSDCYEIYYAGWGGQTNQSSQATQSTTIGFPTTVDGYQQSTNGNNFYIAVLGENATSLNYATYMGGLNSSPNHVDGGTSRFDKKGRIYHAVCGACGGNPNGFTTTPGVVSPVNQSSNCNLAAFKFDLGIIESTLSVPVPYVCLPNAVNFINNSQNANSFIWYFGDGNSSTQFEPSYVYAQPGDYTVTLISADSSGCYEIDSSQIIVSIGLFEGLVTIPPSPICPGVPYQLEAGGGSSYSWSPANVLDNPSIANPIATIDQPTVFSVIVSDSCGTDTLTILLDVYGANAAVIQDTSICLGQSVELWAMGGGSYAWSPSDSILSNPSLSNVMVTPSITTTYEVLITTPEGCEIEKSVTVSVFNDPPIPVLIDTAKICMGDSIEIVASGGVSYSWYPNQFLNIDTGPIVVSNPSSNIMYYVDFTNACGTVTDSIYIELIEVYAQAGNDTIVCPGDPVMLWASGGIQYQWFPSDFIASPNSSTTSAVSNIPTTYTVLVTDQYGCQSEAYVNVLHFPMPYVHTSPDFYGFQGDEIQLSAEGSDSHGTYEWSPSEYLSCVNCSNPISYTLESMTYTVEYTDDNGCKAYDDVTIYFEGIVYVPNTFTPDGNKFNDNFYALGGNIAEFSIQIFNRWGELIFEGFQMDDYWDGTYQGKLCPDGTYIWKIRYVDVMENEKYLVGHVNLLR